VNDADIAREIQRSALAENRKTNPPAPKTKAEVEKILNLNRKLKGESFAEASLPGGAYGVRKERERIPIKIPQNPNFQETKYSSSVLTPKEKY
jgi:hypothetical protein